MDRRRLVCSKCARSLSVFLAGTKFLPMGMGVEIICPRCKEANTFHLGNSTLKIKQAK